MNENNSNWGTVVVKLHLFHSFFWENWRYPKYISKWTDLYFQGVNWNRFELIPKQLSCSRLHFPSNKNQHFINENIRNQLLDPVIKIKHVLISDEFWEQRENCFDNWQPVNLSPLFTWAKKVRFENDFFLLLHFSMLGC